MFKIPFHHIPQTLVYWQSWRPCKLRSELIAIHGITRVRSRTVADMCGMFSYRDTDLDTITAAQIRRVEDKINNRPMKCLNYQTPNEAYAIEMNKIMPNRNL